MAGRRARRGARLFLERRCARRYRDSGPAVGLEDGRTAERVTHGFQRVPVGAEDLIQRFGKVLQQVKAVGHLGGLRCARTSAVHISLEPISGDDSQTRMLTQPGGECVGLTVMEQGYWPPIC